MSEPTQTIIERLEKDLLRPGGFGPQIVSAGEAVVEKADLRILLSRLNRESARLNLLDNKLFQAAILADNYLRHAQSLLPNNVIGSPSPEDIMEDLAEAIAEASGTEAQRAETLSGSVHNGPAAESGDAQPPTPSPHRRPEGEE